MSLLTTASQTVGPYVAIGFTPLERTDLAPPGVAGERVEVAGRLFDGDGKAVGDGVIEVWQADAEGRYAHPDDPRDTPRSSSFRGFGRIPTDEAGAFRFTTIKPGPVPGPGGTQQAPHLVVGIFMRGLLKRLLTRMYFPGDPANARDPILQLVAQARRATLVARLGPNGALCWDIRCQGSDETVFFDC